MTDNERLPYAPVGDITYRGLANFRSSAPVMRLFLSLCSSKNLG